MMRCRVNDVPIPAVRPSSVRSVPDHLGLSNLTVTEMLQDGLILPSLSSCQLLKMA